MQSLGTTSRIKGRESTIRKSIESAGGIPAFLVNGFLQIEYDPSVLAQKVPVIIDGMTRMIDGEDRDTFAADVFGHDELGWKRDSGLYRRSEREQKWFFHCFKETCDRMRARGAPITEYGDFFMAMDDLNHRGLELARVLAQMFDEYHTAIGRTMPSLTDAYVNGYCLTRGVRYLKRDKGKADATAHFDRTGITAHWWGSRPGLIVVDAQGAQHRIRETDYENICLFAGKKFGGITNYAYGNGTLHGVVDSARNAGAKSDRFAIISFTHPTLTAEEASRVLAREPLCAEIEKNCLF